MYQKLGGIKLYDLLNVLGAAALLIFNFTQINKKKTFLGKNHSIFFSENILKDDRYQKCFSAFEIVFFSIGQYAFAERMNRIFGDTVHTGSNYFGLLFLDPVVISVACIILGVNIYKQMDILTLAYPLALVFAKLGCFFQGCCRGIQWENGLYNFKTEQFEFPVQLVEAALALIIFIFLLFRRKKAEEGTLFPTYLIIYSGTRFFSEFLRTEADVIWNLKLYHFICIAGFVIGFIELIIVKKFGDKIAFVCEKISGFIFKCLSIITQIIKESLRKYALKNGIIKEKNIIHHKKRKK